MARWLFHRPRSFRLKLSEEEVAVLRDALEVVYRSGWTKERHDEIKMAAMIVRRLPATSTEDAARLTAHAIRSMEEHGWCQRSAVRKFVKGAA